MSDKIVKIDLAKGELKSFISRVKHFKKEAPATRRKIISDLKAEGLSQISRSLSSSNYIASEPSELYAKTYQDGSAAIGISGTQAIYDEYGTGTIGERNPHAEKGISGLKPYNSGDTIRPNKRDTSNATAQGIPVGEKYWTYKLNGKKIYTQGRPAGMHVYKAKMRIKRYIKRITQKRVKEWLSKL